VSRSRKERSPARAQRAGFTLIELVITITIIGILVAIALPSYSKQIQKTRRAEATSMLTQYTQGLEKCYTINISYLRDVNGDGTPDCAVPDTDTAPTGGPVDYDIAFTSRTGAAFVMTATRHSGGRQRPGAASTGDAHCDVFQITNVGAKTAVDSGGTAVTDCW
jgi:type IV pilus assembly protein PilE